MTTRGRKYSRARGVRNVTCEACGKATTSGIDGTNLNLCRPCYEGASLSNEHSDYGHDTPIKGCPVCDPASISDAEIEYAEKSPIEPVATKDKITKMTWV